ncbi:hypothetical protein T492DRAFT_970961 [Pavlovales sp. CCMP2436]|nr:hypothetical protein T492DRAFT_970961 [Pavlovales sp. CCMP2436]
MARPNVRLSSSSELRSVSETVLVGGEAVVSWNDGHFARVRAKHGVPSEFLSKFDFGTLRLFGGKGGNLMAFTEDRRYLVKELTKADHLSMLDLAPTIVDRLVQGDSLLIPLFLHFRRLNGTSYLAMRNVFPATRGLVWHKKYDLKGNRDDKMLEEDGDEIVEVHKRCFAVSTCWYGCDVIPCLTTASRKRYLLGKSHAFETGFVMTAEAASRVVGMVHGDADMLSAAGLMDYSLMLGVVRQPESAPVPPADGLNQFVVSYGGWTYIYYMGIIDFLQTWTTSKKVAMLLKLPFAPKPLSTVPPAQYAHQFASSLERKFKGEASVIGEATYLGVSVFG